MVSPSTLPFLSHINPLSPGWDSYHLISKVFLLLLESAPCHTLASPAFWKHRLPLPPSALGSGMPHDSCNQSWECRIWRFSQFGSPVPFQPDLLPHTLLPLVCPITQLSLELSCAFLFCAFPNSHSSVRIVPVFQDPVQISASRAFLFSFTLLFQYLVKVCVPNWMTQSLEAETIPYSSLYSSHSWHTYPGFESIFSVLLRCRPRA